MKIKRIKHIITSLVLLGVLFAFPLDELHAAEINDEPYIFVDSYEVSNGEIVPGEPFELTINFKNSSKNSRANDVLINIANSEIVSTVYPSVSQVYVGDIAPDGMISETFKLITSSKLNAEALSIYVTINMGDKSNYVALTVPVKLDDAKFSILSSNIPDTAESGQMITSSVHFKINGIENMSDVSMSVSLDDEIIAEGSIGNMRSGATKTQSISYYIYETGTHSLSYVLEGVDSDGQQHSIEAYSGDIFVSDASVSDVNTQELIGPGLSTKKKAELVVCGVLSCLFLLGIIWTIKKNR